MNVPPLGSARPEPVQSSVRSGESTPSAEDIEKALEEGDLKYAVQKRLVETLLAPKKEETSENEESPDVVREPKQESPPDRVEISAESLELYRRERARISVERADGARLEVSYERVDYARVEQTQVQEAEPLVLDLDGDGLELTDVREGEGVRFDITGNGVRETVSWVAPDDGFLAYDRNGSGLIDSGRELFGDQHGAANGFEELATFDADGNGSIDEADPIYKDLRVWRDLNRNGTSESNELTGMSEHGISSLDLTPDGTRERIAGNRIEGYGAYHTSSREDGKVGEVFLNYLG